jgi:DNA-binding transcriptional LysR family regulator
LREVRKGASLIGANEARRARVLPLIARSSRIPRYARRGPPHPRAADGAGSAARSVDFGVLTFNPPERELLSLVVGADELVLLVAPGSSAGGRKQITMERVGRRRRSRTTIRRRRASGACAVRTAARAAQHPVSLPSLDGIKRAVEMGLGVALLPRRCAQARSARGQLVEFACPSCASPRQVRFVYRRDGELSHAAQAFLDVARRLVQAQPVKTRPGARR